MAEAMVLCAGFGTRLRPLTEELPKPLVPIGDRSILAHIADQLVQSGFDAAVINTHWLPETFSSVLPTLPLRVSSVHEPEIRGTAGGVAGARSLLRRPPVLVWNGDILVEPPIAELLGTVDDGLCLALVPRSAGEGTVGRDRQGRVVRLRGEIFGDEVAGGDYVGVAALGERCVRELPDVGCLVGDWALPELRRGRTVRSVVMGGPWVDAGDPSAYLAANLAWLERRGLERWIGPGAAVAESVQVRRSIIGSGARVTGAGVISNTVVWPGAALQVPIDRAIVTASGRVVSIA